MDSSRSPGEGEEEDEEVEEWAILLLFLSHGRVLIRKTTTMMTGTQRTNRKALRPMDSSTPEKNMVWL